MTQIKPMLLKEVEDKNILRDDSKWFQVKENGVRAILHIKNHRIVGIRNRTNKPIFHIFPELKNVWFNCGMGIVDAEICVFNTEGKSVFYGGIDKRRSAPTKDTLNKYPATIVAFDVLKYDDEILVTKPYKERYNRLKEMLEYQSYATVAENYTSGIQLWDKVVQEDLEGVVAKNPNSPYELGKRSENYIKIKNYKYTTVEVKDTEPNNKGTKVFGTTKINGEDIEVECQFSGEENIREGDQKKVKYLELAGNKLIQPTKAN